MSTLRSQPGDGELPAMTYWRRRFLALTVGLGVLSLIVWAFSGALGGSGAGGPAAAGAAHASRGRGDRAGGPGPRGRPAAPARPPAAASAGQAAQAGPGQGTGARPAPAPALARACKPGDVVLSLFSSQDSYGQGQPPEFDVDVVSTAARNCAFNVGPQHLSLVVRAGRKRVWGSADCAAAGGSAAAYLARGVPAIVPFSWDLRTSARGCRGTPRPAPPGSYTAEASDGRIASNQVRFTVG